MTAQCISIYKVSDCIHELALISKQWWQLCCVLSHMHINM